MTDTTCSTVYFEQTGPKNTSETLRLAKKRADELGIRSVVVASTSGETGVKASEVFKGYNLVVVSHVTGFTQPNVQQLLPKNREIIENRGANVLTAAHAFGTLGRAVANKFESIQLDGIVSGVLRLFGQGVKVGCEIACMASDAGLIRVGEDVVVVGGTGSSADTALVLVASNTHTFFDLKIREVICKPRL
ncbi:MAG: pyruvate kinase alpha/beta domain-containing protein [Candidatus Bathyarchaeia archaeon]